MFSAWLFMLLRDASFWGLEVCRLTAGSGIGSSNYGLPHSSKWTPVDDRMKALGLLESSYSIGFKDLLFI